MSRYIKSVIIFLVEWGIDMSLKDVLLRYKKNLQERKESKQQIKNLKVGNVKKKKYKLVKVAIVGVIVATIGLGIWANGNNDSPKVYNNNSNTTYVTEVEPQNDKLVFEKEGEYADEVVVDTIEVTPVSLSQENYKYFSDFLKSYEVDFPYSEMFNYDEATAYFNSPREKVTSHKYSGFIVNGKVDEAKLLESVKKNNPIFREEGRHYMYTMIEDDNALKEIISYVATSLNDGIRYKTEEEIAELDCVLGELTIYYGTGVEAAKVTTENALLVNKDMIKAMSISSDNANTFRNTLYHEAKHLEQVDCIDYKNYEYSQQGISRTTEKLAVNPYQWLWTAEGGAEKGSMNITEDPATSYKYLIGYIEALDVASIPSSYSRFGGDIERTTTNREIDTFYNLMGINDGITQKEIVEMMYAIEIMQGRVSDFNEIYKNYYGKELNQDMSSVKEMYRGKALTEIAKIFYSNLAKAVVSNKNITLEDINYLISVFEGTTAYHLQYNLNVELNKDYTQDFLNSYNEIQSKFFEALALSNNIEYSDLLSSFNNYKVYALGSNGTKVANASLSFLNEEQKAWLQSKISSERMTFTNPINVIVDSIEQQKTK